jgi:tetratricopeptide (TPR) repeat protein
LLRDLLANRYDIRESDPIVEVRQKFETAITDVLTDAAEAKAHFLGQWLGYDFGHSPHVATIGEDAEQLKNRGVLYLSQLWKRVAGERPVLLFLEDIHWADAPSLAAILDVLRREPALPLLVVALTRSSLFEHHPTWQELGQENKIEGLFDNEPAYYFVNLNPLPSTADHELLAEILQKVADIPPKLFNLVADRAEGNPFYMEEFVKMLIDGGVIEPGKDLWQVDLAHLDERRIPGTLTGVLQARLDRLAVEERGTLQRAAVIGRVFWDTAVQRLSGDRDQVQLVSLQKRELIYRQSETAFVNTHQFLFKHDLLRDVTYQTVLKKARQLYHGRVADWLVEVAGVNGRTDEYAAVIAEHYQLAEQQDKAAHWYGRAGQDAATRYAHSQAIHYLILALDLTAKDDNTTRYTLLSAREKVYDLQGNRQAQFEDLEQLASVVDGLGIIEQATVSLRQARYADMTGEYDYAIICAQAAIELGQPQDHTDIVSAGHEIWGKALWHQGQFLAAQEKYLAGLQLARTGANPRLVRDCLAGLGDVAWNQGEYASAQGYYEQALAICQENGDRQGEGESLKNLGNVALYQGEYTSAQGYYEQALAICRNIGNRQVEGESLNNLGNVALYQGDYASAQRYYKQSLAICREMGDRQGEATSLNNLGVVARRQGEYASAQKYYEQSLAIRQVIGDRKGEGESFNNLGLATWGQGDYASTKRHYEHSLAISQEIGDRKGEGICLHNLAFIASYQREYASALKYYEQSLAIRQEIGDQWGEGESLNELGVVARRQGDYASAQRYYEQSLAIKQKIGDRRGEGYSLNNLGTVALCQGEYMVAQRYLEQSLAIFRETGDRLDEGESLNQLGALMLARSNLQLAELYYQQAVAIHEELNQPHCLVENWAGLAKVKLVKGVQENAWKYAQQILEYLNTNPQLNGVESPIRTFHFIWDVLIALGQIGEAKGVLSLAIQAMQDYLNKNSDPTTQAMYLGQPHHQVLWVAWQQRQETH